MRIVLALALILAAASVAKAGMFSEVLKDESLNPAVAKSGCTAQAKVGCHGTTAAFRTPVRTFLKNLFTPRATTCSSTRVAAPTCSAAPRVGCAAAPAKVEEKKK